MYDAIRRAFVLAIIGFIFPQATASEEVPQLPANVVRIYLFLQDPGSTAKGSGQEVATMLTPEQFRADFPSLRDRARRERMKLIITAETSNGLWVQDRIRYRGEQLKRVPYYNEGIDKVVPGAEIPTN